ncbi:MAG: response regulator [Desulfobacterales bacterium]|nr:response regulator [Desulfobacterales bacterium]
MSHPRKNLNFWKKISITTKFSGGVSLLILLMLVVALTGYISLHYVRKADDFIRFSTKIQALVFEMDRRMEKARHLNSEFFVQYPRIGLQQAHDTYAKASIREAEKVISISHNLAETIKNSQVSNSLRESNIDLNLYLSSAKRFADTAKKSIDLVNRMVTPETGLEDVMSSHIQELETLFSKQTEFYESFHEMEHFIKDYRLKRERHLMQSAFNMEFKLRQDIQAALLDNEVKQAIDMHLEQIHIIANKILDTDVAIDSKFRDFHLQQKAARNVSEKLIRLAKNEVAKSEEQIAKTYRTAAVLLTGITGTGLIIAVFIAFMLHINITRRILQLTRSAERLKGGYLDVTVKEGPLDELGRLEKAFNYMTARMRKLVRTLEKKVRERTYELRKSNKHLQLEIRDRKQVEDQLRQSHKMEAIGTLAGGIAHEFNNILGIIIGNAELAIDDTPEWNPAHKNISEIKRAGLRAKEVVLQLLSFSRKTEQVQKPIDIAPVIKESIKLIRSSIPSNIEIHDHVPRSGDLILADTTQIHQVFINLCTNAAHAMDDNSEGFLKIFLDTVDIDEKTDTRFAEIHPGKYLELTVKDSGKGIEPKIRERIFDPYFTTKEIGMGTGMGLAVVHGIVTNHNGKILVNSEPGKGTSISILLPVVTGVTEPQKEPDRQTSLPTGNETILFVDDEFSIVESNKMLLEKIGYTVREFTNPLEALSAFKSSPNSFDLVISDVTMPKMNGVDLSKNLRKIRPDIPVIICSGHSSHMDEEKALKLNINAYTMKPVTASQIAVLIRKVLADQNGNKQIL